MGHQFNFFNPERSIAATTTVIAGSNGPQTAPQLHIGPKVLTTTVLKQLASMREAGLVGKKDNSQDRRQPIYFLPPAVPLTQTETGVFMDFGFCTVRL